MNNNGGLSNPKLIELVKEKEWKDFTLPQKLAIPKIKEGYNVLLVAPTGYGKTEAALLPIFELMLKDNVKPVAVVYITPLRALINDITRRLKWWTSKLGFTIARKHGDVPSSEKAKRLRKVPHIIITTPESLEIDLDWAQKFRSYYANVRWVIIDEVHELIASKRGIQLSILLERLKEVSGKDFQRVGLSATIGNPREVASFLFGSSKRKSAIIEIDEDKEVTIELDAINPKDGKENLWAQAAQTIIKHIEPPSLIFVNSRSTAERLHEVLEKHGLYQIQVHHSSISKDIKTEIEKALLERKLKGVVCTKTLELGIDVGDIRKVIQFRPPGSVTALLQRIGRSGHKFFDISKGTVISVGEIDTIEALATIFLALKKDLEEPVLLNKPLDVLAREIIGIILQYGSTDLKTIYKIVKGAYPYRDLTFDELRTLVDYLAKNGMINIIENRNKCKIGSTFFKIWRFNANEAIKRWWARNFAEFFTTIGERPSFQVKYNDRIIGDVDSQYVYRYLRIGDIVRLSGRNWKVIEIDDTSMKITVVPAASEEAEVPIWRGEGARRSRKLSKVIGELLQKLAKEEDLSSFNYDNVKIMREAIKSVKKLVREYKVKKFPIPDERTLIVEKDGDETVFLYWMGQNIAETLSHVLMYLISSKYTLNVYTKSSYMGFAVKVKNVDPLKILLNTDPEKLDEIISLAITRSPLYYATLKELQTSFGKIGKIDEEYDRIIIEEAKKQILSQYMDVKGAKDLLRNLKEGRIKVLLIEHGNTPLGKYVKELPPMRPWIRDSSLLIIRTLEGIALTVEELAEILELPPKSIENKLKELRKPEAIDRVFQFIDIDIGEWRWSLIRDAEEIYQSPEYRSSFEPSDVDEVYTLYIKPNDGYSYYAIYFTCREILNDKLKFLSRIPVKEAYEVRVLSSDSMLKSLAPRYFYVPREVLPYIVLNGVAFIQLLKESG